VTRHLLRPLDRYVLSEFLRIFITTALGFPLLVIVIDITDKLERYLARNLGSKAIFLSYLYWIPDSMFLVLPAAVLFATVFSIGSFTRHAEVTAAKASGISFFRLVMPIFLGSVGITLFGLALGELVPITNAKRSAILQERKFSNTSDRFNFAYAAQSGRVYKIAALSQERRALDHVEIERRGRGRENPTYLVSARVAQWDSTRRYWTLRGGQLHILPDSQTAITVSFDSLRDKDFREAPTDLTATPHDPDEMRFGELKRFIASLDRSGADTNELKVELSLKVAIPFTCIIIAVLGSALATSTQRGGAAFGIGVSLAITLFFLMLIQITKAIGGGGLLPPYIAAWVPNAIFAVIGGVMLARTRT